MLNVFLMLMKYDQLQINQGNALSKSTFYAINNDIYLVILINVWLIGLVIICVPIVSFNATLIAYAVSSKSSTS